MPYYNYHATAQRLIREGKLLRYYYTKRHNAIAPALVLLFDDIKHPCMPIRRKRWAEYAPLLADWENQPHPENDL